MKTGVTVIKTIETGMDSYKDLRITKVFEDSTTLLEIKQWVKDCLNAKIKASDISLGSLEFSDVES